MIPLDDELPDVAPQDTEPPETPQYNEPQFDYALADDEPPHSRCGALGDGEVSAGSIRRKNGGT